MNNGIPPAYQAYRGLWSVLHIAVLLVVAFLIGGWWFTNSNGADLVAGWWAWASDIQQSLFNWIPFPWTTLS